MTRRQLPPDVRRTIVSGLAQALAQAWRREHELSDPLPAGSVAGLPAGGALPSSSLGGRIEHPAPILNTTPRLAGAMGASVKTSS